MQLLCSYESFLPFFINILYNGPKLDRYQTKAYAVLIALTYDTMDSFPKKHVRKRCQRNLSLSLFQLTRLSCHLPCDSILLIRSRGHQIQYCVVAPSQSRLISNPILCTTASGVWRFLAFAC